MAGIIKKITIIMFLCIPAVSSFAADEPFISFFMGTVTVESGGAVIPVKVGMILPNDGTLRTAAGSFAELRIGSSVIMIKEKQTVKCAALAALPKDTDKTASVMRKIMKGYSSKNIFATVAAVRAENKSEETMVWDTGEADAPPAVSDQMVFDAVNEASGQNDYAAAVKYYEKFISEGGIAGEKTSYIAAFAYQELCRYKEARDIFERLIQTSKNPQLAASAAVSAGIASYGLADYSKAIIQISAYLEKEPRGTMAAQGLFFRGMSYKISSQKAKADEDFRRLSSSYPDDPLAQAAAQEMSSPAGKQD